MKIAVAYAIYIDGEITEESRFEDEIFREYYKNEVLDYDFVKAIVYRDDIRLVN